MLDDYRKPNGELPFEGIINRLKSKTEQKTADLSSLFSRPLYNNTTTITSNNNYDTYDTTNRKNWVSTGDISEYEEYDVYETVYRDEQEVEDDNMDMFISNDPNYINIDVIEESYPETIQSYNMPPIGTPIYTMAEPITFIGNNQINVPNPTIVQGQNTTFQPYGHPITNKLPSSYMDVEEVRRLAPPTSSYYKGNTNTECNVVVLNLADMTEEEYEAIASGFIENIYNTDDDDENTSTDEEYDVDEADLSNYNEPIYANKKLIMHSSSFAEEERRKGILPPNQNVIQQNPFAVPPMQQQQVQYNPYNNPNYNFIFQQQQQTPFNPYNISAPGNYIFAPAMQNPYNPYGYQQPKVDYYNPFPEYQNRQQLLYYGYNNTYNPYFRPFMSVQMREQIMQQNTTMGKLRYKIACAGAGIEYVENTADEIFNPMNKVNKMSDDDRVEMNHWNFIQRARYFEANPNPLYQSEAQLTALYIQTYFKNYHEAFDKHSLCEFFEEDYPRLMREFWIADNVKRSGRDLNSTYSSDSYRELLKLHNANNPFISQLLNNFNPNQYDNNSSTDQEIGVLEMLQYSARKDYQSRHPIMKEDPIMKHPEIKKMKTEFIDSITEQMNSKYTMSAAKLQHNLIEKTKVDKPVNQATNQTISFMLDQTSTGIIDSN